MATFHNRCGKRVTLLNNNCTAVRNDCEFNHGIVLSAEPLVNDSLFEVKIDKKINSWSGNIEIGVTACDPETLELPACGILLRNGSWIMSGNSILKDGLSLVECYGEDLDKLSEHDRIGVMRTADGELVIYINGVSQGVAAEYVPSTVYAVVDMYGKCTQVSICNQLEHNNDDYLSCAGSAATIDTISLTSNLSELSLDLRQDWNVSLNLPPDNTIVPATTVTTNPPARDRLRFHQRCGSLIKLTSNSRTAERRRPFDEFNNGVVMTHRPLYDDELFEIRIDRLVEKWSGSIEVGVTTHNPTALEFPATMTNMRTGTIMMSGCGILSNGKGSRREYGEFNLDELREGDRVGMMRKSNGNLHYFINGLDQGVAASKVAQQVWGVIDLYGMTMKVTIVDRDEREEQNLITRRNTSLQEQLAYITDSQIADTDCYDRLLFHSNCGTHADVINNGRTAHRPNATDDFNNGVVLTSRPLKANELFEVRLDKIVSKWAGSIEIGVTTHSPTEFEFPFTMTNVRSGTWMMTGNGVMHNGTTIVDQYGINLDRLQIGDRVGVMRKENGTLHFYVNGVDQGPTARNLPERVYGVIDLYGQAAQVTIQYEGLDCYSPETVNSSISNTTLYSDLRFHHVHGKNARIINNGLTASRPRAYAEFNDAIIFSNRPLRDEEMFEIVIDNMVDRWSGGIELGVTAMRPEELDLPSTATDLDHDTWMLSGSAVMENGVNLKNGYKCDLDTLTADRRVGLMRHSDSMLHFYVDGVDQGPACQVARGPLYAVVDLYGQCAQVSLASAPRAPNSPHSERTPSLQASVVQPSPAQQPQPPDSYLAHRFSEWHGKNITLSENDTIATRIKDSSHSVVFSSTPLATDELFEVCLMATALQYAGSLKIGVTTLNDPTFPNSIANIPADCWYITGNEVRTKTRLLSNTFSPSLEWLRVGDRIGLKRAHDSTLRAVINSQDIGVVAHNVPESVYAVVELCGRVTGVEVTSSKPAPPMTTTLSMSVSQLTSLKLHDSLELVLDPPSHQYVKQDVTDSVTDATDIDSPTEMDRYEFYENHGRNIEIFPNKITAKRVASYNQGIVIVSRPLIKGQILEIKIDQINEKWTSSLILGVVCVPPGRVTFPVTALGFKKHCWIISSDWLSINGTKMKSNYGQCLENLGIGSRVGLLLSEAGRLSLVIDGLSLGPLPAALPLTAIYHAVFDLYGQCEQITLLNNQCDNMDSEDHLLSSVITSSQQMSEPSTSTSKEKSENHQCEKADLESREKESNIGIADSNLSEAMNGNGLMMNDSVASANALNEQLINAATSSMANSLHASVMHSGGFRRCEYLRECMQFKKSLVLPDEFFALEDPICYCNNCYQPCADELYLRKGDPAEEYSVPLGWAKFVLKCSMTNAMIEKWHVAFYGAKVNVIRSILDRGQPLNKEQLQWSNLISQPVVTGESTSSQIEFSPNVQYAASDVKYSYVDNRTKNKIVVSTAFQLLVRPGSYSVTQVSSVPAEDSDKIRPVCEWCTKETGAIVLNSLLIKLECF